MTASLVEHFSSLEDPRIERNKCHALVDIIVLTVCAVASGANGWEAMEEFGKEKLDWLRQYVPLKERKTKKRTRQKNKGSDSSIIFIESDPLFASYF